MTTEEILFILLVAFANSLIIIGVNKSTYFDFNDDLLRGVFGSASFTGKFEYRKYRKAAAQTAIDDKMIFWKLRYWSLKYLGELASKPLFTCPPCMASFHSLYFYWLIMPFTLQSLIAYPFYILGLAGMVSIVNNYA